MAEAKQYQRRMQRGKSAQVYADRFETGSRKGINAREQRAVAKIFDALPECRSVIDVPSGAALFSKVLSHERELIEADVAFEILEHARERAEHAKLNLKFLQSY